GSNGDGANPYGGLIMDRRGNLYETTEGGGAFNYGTVFELAISNGSYFESVLHSFEGPCCGGTGADGANPYASLIMDSSGNLYGTTYQGGAYGQGTVFDLTVGPAPTVALSPTSLTFSSQNVVSTSAAQAFTLINS